MDAEVPRCAAALSFDLSAGTWFDLHHTHFDWVGHRRRGTRHRRSHLAALFTAFRRAAEQARASDRPVQVWLSIAADHEVEQDALYLHSANPNGTAFPYPFHGVEWSVEVPEVLRDFVGDGSEVGYFEYEGQPQYVVRERGSSLSAVPHSPAGV